MTSDHPKILALDLGTSTGWARRDPDGSITYGTWTLSPPASARFDGAGMRWVRLRTKLLQAGAPALVAVEAVAAHKGTAAAHVYGGLLATVQSWCEQIGSNYTGVPVGTIKKHATGSGSASKAAMIEAAEARGWKPADDNQADALWLLDYVEQEFGGGL